MNSTTITSPILGPLRSGEFQIWEVILTGQKTYDIFVQAYELGVDFDLYVYDEKGNLIDLDERIDSRAYCSIMPYWTQPVQIVVKCDRGTSKYQVEIEEV